MVLFLLIVFSLLRYNSLILVGPYYPDKIPRMEFLFRKKLALFLHASIYTFLAFFVVHVVVDVVSFDVVPYYPKQLLCNWLTTIWLFDAVLNQPVQINDFLVAFRMSNT